MALSKCKASFVRNLITQIRTASTASLSNNINIADGNTTAIEDDQTTVPVVINRHQKWIKMQGCKEDLVDFTSSDVLGIQSNTSLTDAEHNNMSTAGLSSKYRCYHQSLPGQTKIEEKLSYLHGKESTLMSSDTFMNTLNTWLRCIPIGKMKVFVHESCSYVDEGIPTTIFSSKEDLAGCFKDDPFGTMKFVILEVGYDVESIKLLRDACDAVEGTDATVVLLDPSGSTLTRHVIGDNRGILEELKRPHVIQTTLDPIHGSSSVTYISASKKFTEWCQQVVAFDCQVISPPYVARTLKAIELLPGHFSKGQTTLLHSARLKTFLSEHGIKVIRNGNQLKVYLENLQQAHAIRTYLWNRSHHVSITSADSIYGIEIQINGYHEDKDIDRLSKDILEALHSNGLVKEEVNIQQLPLYSPPSRSLRECMGNTNSVDIENHSISNTLASNSINVSVDRLFTSQCMKLNPQHLYEDLQWLKSLYCMPLFDECLEENLSIFGYNL